MRCKDIERLRIDGADRNLSGPELDAVERHITQCSSCARFQEDLQRIRNGLSAFSRPFPSEKLVKKTRDMCYVKMEAMRASGPGGIQKARFRSVPKIIWAAIFALVALTGILILPFLPGFEIHESSSLKTILAFTLIVQNAAMLFFAPVLIRKFGFPKNGLNANGNENLVP